MSGKSAEQQARDLLELCGVEDAQSFTAGDVVALANVLADAAGGRRKLAAIRGEVNWAQGRRDKAQYRALANILAILDSSGGYQ